MSKHLFFLPITVIFLFLNFQLAFAQKSGIETAGDIGLIAVPAAALTVTLINGDRQGTWQFTKGFLLNQGVTYGLKVALNKPRPFGNGDNAFPSGHTSTTFQGASFIHKRYGFKYSIPAYAVAGFTAFSRIDAQKHDGWDILAGAVVGIGSTLLFTTEYQQEHMELTFNNSEGDYLLGFKYKF
ncbi:phosphatase PAP2 family protein [Subsaxibacter sp. CAU 1640]|uniref:phosphatase PAP2 family protein n=1 Tax=Subsaxibacter sp. CAU 1640 TaxID=2933271 RepID=UPI002003C898|nr:phosphatase PAP2 family protein [Subsaxibacter sp. CAU 1640]MCK7591342.1 phosphatase PAP2 family protein [Subsaxibacter sp. CAU 1640]